MEVVNGSSTEPGERETRAERLRRPTARQVLEATAADHGVCARPVALRRTDVVTGETAVVDVPCGATLAAKCPTCAERARKLRAAQCRKGWHLDHEPDVTPDAPTVRQRDLATERADLVQIREATTQAGADVAAVDADIGDCDAEIAATGVRGSMPDPADGDSLQAGRRVRSTRHRQDAPDLPRHRVDPRTIGRVYTDEQTGRTFRPSLFLTLTLDTYGRVHADGTPVHPDRYDYRRAARDALHFSKLVDRFVQNLRRAVGWNVQYFAAVEPQRRLAPHIHMAIRGTIPRVVLRQVAAATYHQVWWPACDRPVYLDRPPSWQEAAGEYVDPDTGEALPTWDDALDAVDDDETAEPVHVARFGPVLDAQGVLAGTPGAQRCVSYLAKYLTKSVDECHEPGTDGQREHVTRLVEALRCEPCAPTCSNWLRYGIQPKHARAGMRPGHCRSKAHKPTHLGYGGRRVLVSRQWSGKSLGDHRADRRAWAIAQLEAAGGTPDVSATNPGRYTWRPATLADPDVSPLPARIMRAIARRAEWRRVLATNTGPAPPD